VKRRYSTLSALRSFRFFRFAPGRKAYNQLNELWGEPKLEIKEMKFMKLKSLTSMKGSKMNHLMKVFSVIAVVEALFVLPLPNSPTSAHDFVDSKFALARYNSNGSLDTSFLLGGMVLDSFPVSRGDEVNAIAIQPNGKIVAVGSSHDFTEGHEFAVARYNPSGFLDGSFCAGFGKCWIGLPNSVANAIAIQPDGKIVVAGTSSGQFKLWRLNSSNGFPDNTFAGGVLNFPTSTNEVANAIAIQSDGKIVVAGSAYVGGGHQFALARCKSNGSLDTTFGKGGLVLTNFPTSTNEVAYGIALAASGRIVVAGYATVGGGAQFALARYNSNGSLDTTFGSKGLVLTNFSSSLSEVARAIRIDASGRIVVAGYANVSCCVLQFALARYNSNGSLDTTFDSDGKVLTPFSTGADAAVSALALSSGGKIVAAGYAVVGGGRRFALARYNSNGSLDSTFDSDGKVTTDIKSTANEGISAIAIDASGKIVVGGYAGGAPIIR
jgi:uncharacterized delta-60 repeat protein